MDNMKSLLDGKEIVRAYEKYFGYTVSTRKVTYQLVYVGVMVGAV